MKTVLKTVLMAMGRALAILLKALSWCIEAGARFVGARTLRQLLIVAAAFAGGCVIGVAALVAGYVSYYRGQMPDVARLKNYNPSLVTTIYDRKGNVAAEFYTERRVLLKYEDIPDLMKKATLAIEDEKFFQHGGIDVIGIFRAAAVNLKAGEVVQGGSTITQQVAKVMFLSRERTFARKLKEFIIAFELERHLTKEEILDVYLNQIYYGHGCYGVEAAAGLYFDKPAKKLTLGEIALLAGLPKAPNSYSPFNNEKGAVYRRGLVLRRMLDSHYITQEQADKANAEPVKLAEFKHTSNDIPYFAEHIRRYLYTKYGADKLYHEGLRVYTTLDTGWQMQAQRALADGIEENDRRIGWRGIAGHIDPAREEPGWEKLNPVMDKISEEDYFAKGKAYKGVVTKVAPDRIAVSVNGVPGTIEAAFFAWAHEYNPKEDGRGYQPVKDATRLVKPGDIIEVKLLDDIRKGALQLMLHQTPALQGALVSLDYASGEIRAMVGGYDFGKSPFNRAVQALRQPGSAFKPVIYSAALDRGFTPSTIVIDSPVTLEGAEEEQAWKPANFANAFYGPTTIRTAVTESRNVVTIKVLDKIGIHYVIDWARALGIVSPLKPDLSVALGSSSVSLMELTSVYGVIANKGMRLEPIAIRRIETLDGKVLETAEPAPIQVMPEDTAYLMTNVMTGVVEEGTATAVRSLGAPTAGKTGTTNDYVDAWFIGFTSGVVTGVWIGRDQREPIGKNEVGGRAAAPIWLNYMRTVIKDLEVKPFTPPKNIVFVRINKETGLLTTPDDPQSFFESFKEGTEPREFGQRPALKAAAPPAAAVPGTAPAVH
ncbi:MAG: PBP1A family penicillin-binding protein [Nitrospinae bacterium]|nr:PBP1A family penicillin-binding protein [Nitrospinota bacterium]